MPSDAAKDLRARLGATRLVLAKLAGRPSFAQASRTQAKALTSALKSVGLTDNEKSELLGFAADVGFADEDFEAISVVLIESSEPAEKKSRKQMQNFESILEYFTAAEWEAMKSMTAIEVRQCLFNRMARLGGRTPTEDTKQLLACAVLVLTSDLTRPIHMDSKTAEYDSIRKA